MGFSESVMPLLCGSTEGVILVDRPDPIRFETLAGAVVVLHAIWSGPSAKVVKRYVEVFRSVFESAVIPVEFHIINLDKISPAYMKLLPGRFGGNGETFFVKNGVICSNIDHYSDEFESEFLRCFSKVG